MRETEAKTPIEVERLGKEILGLRKQHNHAAETLVLKDQQLMKLDNDYRALPLSEYHVSHELAGEQRPHKAMKIDLAGLTLLMRELGGQW